MNHIFGHKKKKLEEEHQHLGEELIDCLFTLCCIANNNGVNLQEEWDKMVKGKLYGRDVNRFERVKAKDQQS